MPAYLTESPHVAEDPKDRLLARIDARFCDASNEDGSLTLLLRTLSDAIDGTAMDGADLLAVNALITDMQTLLARAEHLVGRVTRSVAA